MKLRCGIKLISLVLIHGVLGWHIAVAADAPARWMLMSRQGACVEINSLTRKLPNLPKISEVSSLIEFLKSQGHFVHSKELRGSAGRAYEIEVSDMSLHLLLVRDSLCPK